MSFYAEIDGAQIIAARIVVPRVGAWFADLTLATEKTLAGALVLRAGDILWRCGVWRSAPYQGRTRALVIGGSAGLQRQLPAKAYRADAGVRLSTVLGDAGREAGELGVDVTTDRVVGPFVVRDVAPAQRMFNRLATEWHVDPERGRIVVGPWPLSTEITDAFILTTFDGSSGRAEVATEALAAFTPGRSFRSPLLPHGVTLTINAVTHTLSAESVRTEILVHEVRP